MGLGKPFLLPGPEAPWAGGAGSPVPGARARPQLGAGAAGRRRARRQTSGRADEGSYCSAAEARTRPGGSEQAGGRQRAAGRRREEDPAELKADGAPARPGWLRGALGPHVPMSRLHPRGGQEATSFWGRS